MHVGDTKQTFLFHILAMYQCIYMLYMAVNKKGKAQFTFL
jgi:hypothetical protein